MKIYDCTTFYSEHMMMDVRFNILDKYVEKFIVTESTYSHSGKRKKLNFDINNYPKHKDKIIYLVIDKEPNDLIEIEKDNVSKRLNSIKRIELSYNYMKKAISEVAEDDLILLSDNDEIPNLGSKSFLKSKKKVILFNQLFFYYKFNLFYDLLPWYGSKACKKKSLKSFSWLKNIKTKKYPFWRIDTYFSENKMVDIEIIKDGGWHFTWLGDLNFIKDKLKSFAHTELNNISINDDEFISNCIKNLQPLETKQKIKLKKLPLTDKFLPKFILKNKKKYKHMINGEM